MENKVYQNGYEKYLTEMKDVLKNDKEDILKQEKLSDEQKEMQRQMMVGLANLFAGYIKKECENNPDFNNAVLQKHKSVKRLLEAVISKAKERQRNGMAYVPDDVVLDWVSDYFFLDDKEEVEAEIKAEKEAKEKAEMEAKIKAEAEAKAKAEAEEVLADDEEYQNASDEEKKKILKAKVSELQKKAERKAKADAKKAKKAAEERKKALERLEEAGAFTDSTSEAEKEKMIEQTIKRIRKEEREAKKAEKEAKAKKEAERDTSIEANIPEKSAHEIANAIAADFEEQEKAEAEAKPEPTPEPSPRDKAIAEATNILESCRAEEVIKLYKHNSLEEFSDVELDNLITHKDQVVARYGKVS